MYLLPGRSLPAEEDNPMYLLPGRSLPAEASVPMPEVSLKQGPRSRSVFRSRGPNAASRFPHNGLNF
eukprot:3015771-Lingulodinium_polyedra.AAC.1